MLKIALLSNLLFLALVHSQRDSFNYNPASKQDGNIPLHKSKQMRRYMNLKADPCTDFYEFSCGNWNKYHTPPKDENFISPVIELNAKINADLNRLLQEQVTLEDGINGRKVKEFYKSCVNAVRNGATQQEFFSEFIKSYGGFPAVPGSNWLAQSHNYNWQQVIGQLRFHYGLNILVGLKIDVNYLHTVEDSIYLGEPSTFIPPELCNTEGTKRVDIREAEYAIIEKEVADNLHMWLSLEKEEANKLAADLVTFEFELCTAIQLQSSNQTADTPVYPNYPRKTLSEFTHQFNNDIDFVSASYGTPIIKPVFLTAEPYFHQLIKTISESNKTTVANYIMYRALSAFSFPHMDQPSNRPLHCLGVAKRYFPKLIGEMYYRKYTNTAAKVETHIMFDKLKHAFEQSLRQPWIEDSTSRIGKSKLAEISLHFATHDKLETSDLQMNTTNYWHNLAGLMAHQQQQQFKRIFDTGGMPQTYDEVEAYETRLKYRPQNKRIEIGWGLLQEPLYHPLYPNAIRYATVGQTLGQALATAFDDLAWSADYTRLLNWDWQTQREYHNRSECFRQQIGNYLHNEPNAFQNVTKLRELIAISSGLNVAFNSYLNWLEFLSPNNDFAILSKETLPEFNFTNTQLFFIAYAQAHCTAEKQNKPTPTFNPLAEHTLERYAVNGPLLNFVEFARDFGCPAGVAMHPADKCVIY